MIREEYSHHLPNIRLHKSFSDTQTSLSSCKSITTEEAMEGFHGETISCRCFIQGSKSVRNILSLLHLAGETQLMSEDVFWLVVTLTFHPAVHLKWVSEEVQRVVDLIDFLFPGTPSWAHLTSAPGRDSLWTPSAYSWPLLGKCQGWAELLWAEP